MAQISLIINSDGRVGTLTNSWKNAIKLEKKNLTYSYLNLSFQKLAAISTCQVLKHRSQSNTSTIKDTK